MEDLQPGMILEGVVTNVTNFGAFVDVGVHQDGLVHISALSHEYVRDPRDVVKTGDVVKVKVVESICRASGSRSPCGWRTAPGQENPRLRIQGAAGFTG